MSIWMVGWPSEVNTARSVTPCTVASTDLILLAVSVSACRSLPYSLIEFSPFTPDTASATLSCRYCEKLNSTPGNLSCSCASNSRGQLVLVVGAGPFAGRLQRREEFGVEQAGGVGAVVGAAVLRHHRFDLGTGADQLAHLVDVGVALLQRDGRRQRGADPQIALLELGQEFEAEQPREHDGQHHETDGAAPSRACGCATAQFSTGM